MMVESFILRIYTVDGKEYNCRQYMEPGMERFFPEKLPKLLANGIWLNDRTFIPGNAIVRAEITAGKAANFDAP